MCDFGKGGLECSWGKQGLYSQNSKRSSKINGRRGTHPTVQNGCCPHYRRRSGESGERLPLSWEFVFTILFFFRGRGMCGLGGFLILSLVPDSLSLGALLISLRLLAPSQARVLSPENGLSFLLSCWIFLLACFHL